MKKLKKYINKMNSIHNAEKGKFLSTETPAPRITAPRVLILDAMTRILLN